MQQRPDRQCSAAGLAAFIGLLRVLGVMATGFAIAGEAGSVYAQPSPPQLSASEAIMFDIPSQPLAGALDAYSAVTGLEVFYNAALAEGRRSNAVVGVLTSDAAIRTLLMGTGYVPRTTALGAFTIVGAPSDTALSSMGTPDRRYEEYFAAVQARISEVLCRAPDRDRGGEDILVRVWLASSGAIARAQVLGGNEKRGDGLAVAQAIRQLKIGAPPAGMPQPVTLVIFPPSAETAKECQAKDRLAPLVRQAGAP